MREALLARVALVDDAHHAMRAGGPAVRAREPAAHVLDPERRAVAGAQRVGRLIGYACPVVGIGGLRDGVVACSFVCRIEQRRIGAAGRDGGGGDIEDRSRVVAPGEGVGGHVPDVGRFADRAQDRGKRERIEAGRGGAGHGDPLRMLPRRVALGGLPQATGKP